MFQKNVAEKLEPRILHLITFFFENLAVNEITWNNIVQTDRPQMTIWRKHPTCWILNSTNANLEYVIFIAFSQPSTNAPHCYVIRTLPVHCLYHRRKEGLW